MNPTLTIARLTIREAQRRRILWMALIMGILFLIVYGVGLHLIVREMLAANISDDIPELMTYPATFLGMAGLYVTNFLIIIMSVLIAVASISGDIESRLIDTLVTKPISRPNIVLGKWLGFTVMAVAYTLFLAGGVLLITQLRTGIGMLHPFKGIAILCLNAVLMMTLTIAGGTRLSTLANGVLAFMLYGIAFIGNWVETIGATFRNTTAINLGIISSLILPTEAIWRKAALVFQPRILGNPQLGGPFAVATEPSDAMIIYSLAYVAFMLWFAIHSFKRRDL